MEESSLKNKIIALCVFFLVCIVMFVSYGFILGSFLLFCGFLAFYFIPVFIVLPNHQSSIDEKKRWKKLLVGNPDCPDSIFVSLGYIIIWTFIIIIWVYEFIFIGGIITIIGALLFITLGNFYIINEYKKIQKIRNQWKGKGDNP